MGRLPRTETMRRLRQMAKYVVQMERGVYEFADGKPHLDSMGNPLVVKKEVLHAVGYDAPYSNLFEDPYYLEQLALERSRTDLARTREVVKVLPNVLAIRNAAEEELAVRLTKDPGSFTNRDLITIIGSLTKIATDVAGAKRDVFNVVNINQSNIPASLTEKLPREEMERLAASLISDLDKQKEAISTIVDAIPAYEREIIEGQLDDD